jgi:hypothetical protein
MFNKTEVLHSAEAIFNDKELRVKFTNEYPSDFESVRMAINSGFINSYAVNLILQLAPTCYEINGKLFLKGEVKTEAFDYVGDDLDKDDSIELYDMSTEMETGDSYTFYVSNTSHFKLASFKDMKKVKDFLDSIK